MCEETLLPADVPVARAKIIVVRVGANDVTMCSCVNGECTT